ncbi:MAG TPA: AraC family transcriptional regulator ligand-binding domain-containing protein [Polyangia bacterium]
MPLDDDALTIDPGTAPIVVQGMLAAMGAAGVDLAAVAAVTGVSVASLGERRDPVPLEQVLGIWRQATKQFGRGTLGLHVGAGMPSGTLLEYVAGASPNLRAALKQVARYIGLASRNIRWVLGAPEADGLTTFEETVTFAPEAIPAPLREFGVTLTASRIRQWFDRPPSEVWFPHPPQGPLEEYTRVLGCPVRFERERVGLRYDEAALETAASKHDPTLFRLLESHAAKVLSELPTSASFRDRVRRAVVERLREGEPGMSVVAGALGTSERSLQRKLQAEGTSFRDVVDEARHKLATVYLGDDSLSMTDVACLLGYSEAAAFTRAFKRWTGLAPSQARRV